jgi:hypothetical protein
MSVPSASCADLVRPGRMNSGTVRSAEGSRPGWDCIGAIRIALPFTQYRAIARAPGQPIDWGNAVPALCR